MKKVHQCGMPSSFGIVAAHISIIFYESNDIILYQQNLTLLYITQYTIQQFQQTYPTLMQPNQEGFEESDHENLVSKLVKNNTQKKQIDTFYMVPQAKPLLNKNPIDMNKPKVLIKEIDLYLQPPELLSYNLAKDPFSVDKPHNSKPTNTANLTKTTIWDKYVLSQAYVMIYLKFYKENVAQLQGKGFRRYKTQLQKMCRNESYLFSTYLIDLSFLSDAGSYLLRNLKPTSFSQINSSKIQSNIQFDSRFESGNLFAVFEKKTNSSTILQYDLILQSDINTKGYSNWFYFSIRNKHKGTIKFNLVNMQKNFALFSNGMKVAVFSMKRMEQQNIEWHRDGYNYSYFRNQLLKNNLNETTYNTLSFQYDILYEDDLIYFAANVPYSYTKMLRFIDSIEKIAKLNSNIYFKRENKALSISSNICPIITLTWKRDKKKDERKERKKIIGVIARQHPCQTVSSYIIEGFINQLVYLSSESAIWLLQNYIFKIVPMVNIDGVIYGNSRCDISGTDINRKWTRFPNKFVYPIIAEVRNIFLTLAQQQTQIDYFIDLHGHSRKKGSFIYGCKITDQVDSRLFAWIMSLFNQRFLFHQSLYGLKPSMKQTARGAMSELVSKKKSMTLETSFYGYDSVFGSKHFQLTELNKLGSSLIETLYACSSKDENMYNWEKVKNEIKEALKIEPKDKKQDDILSDSSCSDKNPQEDEMTPAEKAEHFLKPTVAVKVGLNEISIVKKTKKQEKLEGQYSSMFQKFNDKIQRLLHKKSQILTGFDDENDQQNGPKQPNFGLRQIKSVTKIQPFKFSQRKIRPIASLQKIQKQKRAPIEVVLKVPQKKFTINPPKLEKKNNFWVSLKKEYEILLTQRRIERG